MKGIAGNQTRGLQNGSRLTVIDNTGAKEIEIITVPGYHGVARRVPSAGVGDLGGRSSSPSSSARGAP